MSKRGQLERIRREFAELRREQEQERKRKDARREVRATLQAVARQTASKRIARTK